MALSFLRKFANPAAASPYTNWSQGHFAASSTRLYHLYMSTGGAYRIIVTDLSGNVQATEQIDGTLPSSHTLMGMCFADNNLYLLLRRFTRRRRFQRINVLTKAKSAVSGDISILISGSSNQDDLIVIGTKAYIFYQGISNQVVLRADISGNAWSIDNDFNIFTAYNALTDPNWLFTSNAGGTRFWMQTATSNPQYRAYASNLTTRASADDAVIGTSGLTSGMGLGHYGNGIAVRSTTETFLFGTAPAAGSSFEEVEQYRGLYDFEENFDIVSVTGTSITGVIANDVKGIRATNLSNYSVSSAVEIGTQLSQITFTPRKTIPDVKVGHILFRHTGAAGVAPTSLPSERWTIAGIETVGPLRKQIFYCTAV